MSQEMTISNGTATENQGALVRETRQGSAAFGTESALPLSTRQALASALVTTFVSSPASQMGGGAQPSPNNRTPNSVTPLTPDFSVLLTFGTHTADLVKAHKEFHEAWKNSPKLSSVDNGAIDKAFRNLVGPIKELGDAQKRSEEIFGKLTSLTGAFDEAANNSKDEQTKEEIVRLRNETVAKLAVLIGNALHPRSEVKQDSLAESLKNVAKNISNPENLAPLTSLLGPNAAEVLAKSLSFMTEERELTQKNEKGKEEKKKFSLLNILNIEGQNELLTALKERYEKVQSIITDYQQAVQKNEVKIQKHEEEIRKLKGGAGFVGPLSLTEREHLFKEEQKFVEGVQRRFRNQIIGEVANLHGLLRQAETPLKEAEQEYPLLRNARFADEMATHRKDVADLIPAHPGTLFLHATLKAPIAKDPKKVFADLEALYLKFLDMPKGDQAFTESKEQGWRRNFKITCETNPISLTNLMQKADQFRADPALSSREAYDREAYASWCNEINGMLDKLKTEIAPTLQEYIRKGNRR